MNSGLYAFAGSSATATAAACANRLDEPMTNVSNMYFGLSRLPSGGGGGAPAGGRVPLVAAGTGAPRHTDRRRVAVLIHTVVGPSVLRGRGAVIHGRRAVFGG